MSTAAETTVSITVNGARHELDISPTERLSSVLRDTLDLPGTKIGCDAGDCGACTVVIDEEAVCSCLVPIGALQGAAVETVESLAASKDGAALAASFVRHGAAQCGFCTPGMLMAALALLRENPHPSRDEIVAGLAGVLCRCTGYQKIVDAVSDVDQVRPPLETSIGKAVGSRLERVDGQAKVDGTERFGADDVPANALAIKVVRSPHHRAGFAFGNLDEYVADKPLVTLVITARDIPGQNAFGVIPGFEDQPVLAEEATRFLGEAVALVLGPALDDSHLDDFPIVWTELPPVLTPEAALVPEAGMLHSHAPDNVMIRGLVQKGDVEAALADAEVVVSGRFTTSFVEHAYIEPEAGWAELVDGVVIIHATTQAPYMDREATAKVLGVPVESVRIVPTGCGGGFGGKLDISVQPLLALATTITGKPTSLVYTRPESIISTTKRHPAAIEVSIGASASGEIVGLSFDGTFNTGAYASWGPTVANRVPIHAGGPYLHHNYRASTSAVYTNCAPSGAFRGFGVPQAAIAREMLLDELADRLAIDRLEFRISHALKVGEPTATGQVFTSAVGIGDCLESLREPFAEASSRAKQMNSVNGPTRRGVGIAAAWYGCGNTALPNPSAVRIGLTPNGQIVLHQGATDIGQGSNTVMSQIAADALGVSVSAITLVGPDTDITPDAGKTSASRQTYVTGNATYLAASELREKILNAAGIDGDNSTAELRPGPDGLEVFARGEQHRVQVDTPVDEFGYGLSATGVYDPPTEPLDENGQGIPYAVFGFGAQLIEVDVDIATGRTTVANVVAAYDVGRAVNPTLVEGQIEGGVAQGIGLALMEEFVPGAAANLHDYLIPTIGDVPPIRSVLVESVDPHGPHGAKGIGEHALIPTAPAILNAIRDATGAVVRHVPATPEVVLAAIDEASK